MTGLLIFTAVVVLLALALWPAHRRTNDWVRPGEYRTADRDYQRHVADLRARAQQEHHSRRAAI